MIKTVARKRSNNCKNKKNKCHTYVPGRSRRISEAKETEFFSWSPKEFIRSILLFKIFALSELGAVRGEGMGPSPTRGEGRPWEERGDSEERVSGCRSGLLGPNLLDIGGLVCVLA